MSIKFPLKKGSKKIINAWVSYDWANSVFFLVITSTIFPIYYSSLFVDKNTVSWSNGHEIVDLRNKGLVAGSKGIKAYIRNNERSENIISAEEYLKKSKIGDSNVQDIRKD